MGLNQNSSQRREKGKLLPSCCQTLVWAGQDRGWTSISDLQESTLALRLRPLFWSPIVVFCCRVELPDGDPEHRHILKAKTWTWFWQAMGSSSTPFFLYLHCGCLSCSLLSWFLRVPELPVCCMGSWTSCTARSGFLHSALWQSIEIRKPFSKWVA